MRWRGIVLLSIGLTAIAGCGGTEAGADARPIREQEEGEVAARPDGGLEWDAAAATPHPGEKPEKPEPKPDPVAAYFCATDGVTWSWGLDRFVVKLEDPAQIEEARRLVARGQRRIIVGDVVAAPRDWNPEWNFHLAPESVRFVEAAVEACDGTAEFVEQCGGPYRGRWCPWKSQLLSEIADPASTSATDAQQVAPCASDGPRRPPTYQCLGGSGGA